MKVEIDTFHSPIGEIAVASTRKGEIAGVWVRDGANDQRFESRLTRMGFAPELASAPANHVRNQFAAYFDGALTRFDLPLLDLGASFERAIWRELTFIPFGQTSTYGELASAIGFPGEAQRAGAACAANPWLIVVPCHRVVATDGSLRGYAAGLHIKEQLLAHERGQPSLLLA